jgi:hypothetical protein
MELAENNVIQLACITEHPQDGGWAKFVEILRASPFNKDHSNETTFRPIYSISMDSTFKYASSPPVTCALEFSKRS